MWPLSFETDTFLLWIAQGQRLRSPIWPFYQQLGSVILGRRLYPEVHFSLLLMRACYVCRQYSSNSKLEPTALYQLHALIKTFRTTCIINVLNFSHIRHHLGLMASMEATWLGWKPSHSIKMFSPISTSFGSHLIWIYYTGYHIPVNDWKSQDSH